MSTLGRLGFLLVSAAATVCLDDGVPPEARRYIQNDEGENIPVGLLMCAWASSRLTTQIAQLLIQEALGLHASIHPIEGQFGASPFYALAGCDDFDDPFKRKCGDKETVIHVAMDAWIGSYTNTYTQFQTEYPLIAPIDLGSQGYEGEESMYVSNSVIHEAFASSGLVLDFYKSYNSTTGQPKSYFDAVPDIPLEELQTCEDSLFVDPVTMTNYAKFSGDHDGVILQEDGTYIAKCRPDGRWWESPSCRGSFPACIPLFTAGTGWLLQPMMQWSAAYSIPSAITISKKWKQHVESYRSLWYWWVPDSTFIEMSPQAVIFPRHSPSGWLRGDKATGAKGSYVAKMASTNLQSKAPRVQELVQKVLLELDEIMDLLLDVKVKGSVETTACTWIRNNRDRWDRWIASATYCIQGQGLVNADGEFVQKRSEAAGCAVCSSGTYSEDFDDDGKTRRCAKCSPGYSQGESYSSSCEPCGKGTVAPYAGSTECQLCGVGFYQDRVAQTECTPCSANRTTQLLGAGSKDACICKADSIEDQSQTCIACSKGLWCPIGSTVEKLLLANGTIADSPRLEEGYKSERLDPISVYKCSTPQCPGGAPDSCSRGHQGIACANCQPQHYTSFSGECYPCGIDIPSAILVIFSILLIGVFISYYPLTLPYVAKGSGLFCAAASFGIAVGLLQTLGVLNTAISWQAGETPLLHFASLFVFDLDGFGYNCVADRDVELYGITASFFWGVPLCFVILGLVTNLTPLLKRRGLAWQTTKTVNCIGHFLQVASTTMASVGLLPFMCYDHPNGKQSILKYSNTLCGSAEHLSMQIIGTSLLVLSVSFFSMCCFAAWKAPTWSAGPKASSRIPAIVFLIQRFRPSKWWFGLIIVGRGQLLSLPVVFATNMPNLHLMIMLSVQQLYTNLQLWCQPWKSPILNLGDATATSLLLSLLATSLACIDSCNRVMQTLRMIVSIGLVASLGILVSTTCFNFAYAFVTGKQLKVINLGELDSQRVVDGLQKISQFLDSYEKERSAELLEGLSKLCPYDLSCVLEAIDVLLDDWQLAVHSQDSVKRPERSFSGRISAAHGRRGGSSSSKKSPTRPTHVSLWMEKAETKLQDRQPFHVFDMGDDEVPAEHPNINDVLTGQRLADVETSPPEMMDDEEESPSSVIHL